MNKTATKTKPKTVKKVVKVVKKKPKKIIFLTNLENKEDLIGQPYRHAEYLLFIDWTATPRVDRKPETQKEFAEKYDICKDTITKWKKRQKFWNEVKRVRDMELLDRTGDVLRAIEISALKGDMTAAKLFLQYTGQLSDKKDDRTSASPELVEALKRVRKILPN